ncbi:MAG: hypothetical protein B6D58_01290 [candidate division Zixibacteria bacterium 4484_95]|nr:MAG: hypothetical protein B6D58_01290 [candidate division Zixibacteria bacterium 4484_95]
MSVLYQEKIMDKKINNNKPQNKDNSRNSQEKTIQISFSLTRADLLWYNLYFIRWIVFGAIVLILFFLAGLVWFLNTPKGDLQTAIIWIVIGLAAGFSVCMGSIVAIILQIYFIKSETVAKAMTPKSYIINSQGITIYDKRNQINRPWVQVMNVIRTKRGFYIQTGDKISIVLPRRDFKDPKDLQTFNDILVKYKL